MASDGNLCNTLFYENLSKQKRGYFGLRLKAVFIFFIRVFPFFMDNLPPFFYGGGYNQPLWLSSFHFLWSDEVD